MTSRVLPPAVRWLTDETCRDVQATGGKSAALARLTGDARVPAGFAIVAGADLSSPALVAEIRDAYQRLGQYVDEDAPRVAVRSSAVGEDGMRASFAGQLATQLGVRGEKALLEAAGVVQASGLTARAAAYRQGKALPEEAGAPAVLVQALIPADASLVAFSANPVATGPDDAAAMVVHATWGLGESLVAGLVTPDAYTVRRTDLRIIARRLGDKALMVVPAPHGDTRTVPVPRSVADQLVLTDAHVVDIARLLLRLESRLGYPVDIEAAFWNESLYLLQCRPITTTLAVERGTPHQDQEALP